MTTIVINKNEGNITVRSHGFAETYIFKSLKTDYVAHTMLYIVEAEKRGSSVSMCFPVEMTNKIVIEKDCISNTYQNN
jgi:hypothetical protein